ncbi:hypothetical protein pEaSNUABM29_00159 [Erwinia phage pEa_SNUABM_29]|nr:hypothetical protein pEaSNUABM29_00159 [Erwinia phage pEa_SNUABM_29]
MSKELNLPAGEWKDCVSCPDHFLVNEDGVMFSKRSNRPVRQNLINGYPGHISKVGGRKGTNVVLKTHIQVATAFVPNPENKPCVNHKNGKKTDPRAVNLEWVTHRENTIHAIEEGLFVPPDGSRNIKLSGSDVREILENEHGTVRSVGEKYGVHHSTIVDIRQNPARYLSKTHKAKAA